MRRFFRFSVRDLLWLTLVVAVGLGWYVRERQLGAEVIQLRAELERASSLATKWRDAVTGPVPDDDDAKWFVDAEIPPEDRYGGKTTEFYFEVHFAGARHGDEVLIVSTNDKPDLSRYAPRPPGHGVLIARRDVYAVSSDTAREMDRVLREERFFKSRSMIDLSRTDGVAWIIVAKSPSGSVEVVVSDVEDQLVEDFQNGARQEIAATDGPVVSHAKRVFNVVRSIRAMAVAKGRRRS